MFIPNSYKLLLQGFDIRSRVPVVRNHDDRPPHMPTTRLHPRILDRQSDRSQLLLFIREEKEGGNPVLVGVEAE